MELMERVAWKHTQYLCKIDTQWECAVRFRELTPGFCDHLEGWDRVGGGGMFRREGAHVYL